ncbi:MAG: aminopeptidase [Thermoplasmata archaeon]|nr:MAG: aminopeptidase [Thermoplasmata archaeon]
MKAEEAAKNALVNVLEAASGERAMIICDQELSGIGQAFADGAVDCGLWTRLLMLDAKKIRKDVPKEVTEILSTQKSDIIINLLRGSAEETPFRIKLIKMERRRRIRLGHCPGITIDMLTKGALALKDDEYKKMQAFSDKLIHELMDAESLEIISPSGTELYMSVKDRDFFTDTKLDWKTVKWMNLPVGEVIVAPVENSLNGKLVCEKAIGGVGLIKENLEIEAGEGKAKKVTSKDKGVLKRVKKALGTDSWSNTIGEFAFGLNPNARVCNEFLETEKIKGTCHIAFGNNSDFPGGKNLSFNHMDFLISKPTVEVTKRDGKRIRILASGRFKS